MLPPSSGSWGFLRLVLVLSLLLLSVVLFFREFNHKNPRQLLDLRPVGALHTISFAERQFDNYLYQEETYRPSDSHHSENYGSSSYVYKQFTCPHGFELESPSADHLEEKHCLMTVSRKSRDEGDWGPLCNHLWEKVMGFWVANRDYVCPAPFWRQVAENGVVFCTVPISYDLTQNAPPLRPLFPVCSKSELSLTLGFGVRRDADEFTCPPDFADRKDFCGEHNGDDRKLFDNSEDLNSYLRSTALSVAINDLVYLTVSSFQQRHHSLFWFERQISLGLNNSFIIANDMPAFLYFRRLGVPVTLLLPRKPVEWCLQRYLSTSWRSADFVLMDAVEEILSHTKLDVAFFVAPELYLESVPLIDTRLDVLCSGASTFPVALCIVQNGESTQKLMDHVRDSMMDYGSFEAELMHALQESSSVKSGILSAALGIIYSPLSASSFYHHFSARHFMQPYPNLNVTRSHPANYMAAWSLGLDPGHFEEEALRMDGYVQPLLAASYMRVTNVPRLAAMPLSVVLESVGLLLWQASLEQRVLVLDNALSHVVDLERLARWFAVVPESVVPLDALNVTSVPFTLLYQNELRQEFYSVLKKDAVLRHKMSYFVAPFPPLPTPYPFLPFDCLRQPGNHDSPMCSRMCQLHEPCQPTDHVIRHCE
eukprot:TRINITY_DN2599_c0_g2_i3.p1 TRINITY_DN2599_c0_g2~~TRINITY_DN2599_c0_g2_i3.p1  ORF type:complete len:652 (+),score=190.03 TRINITY_DN2599_c0_g2_i3:80-2035(+)